MMMVSEFTCDRRLSGCLPGSGSHSEEQCSAVKLQSIGEMEPRFCLQVDSPFTGGEDEQGAGKDTGCVPCGHLTAPGAHTLSRPACCGAICRAVETMVLGGHQTIRWPQPGQMQWSSWA